MAIVIFALIVISPIKGQDMEAVEYRGGFPSRSIWHSVSRPDGYLTLRFRTLVWIEPNSRTLVRETGHHAGSRKQGIVHGVGGYVGIAIVEFNRDYD